VTKFGNEAIPLVHFAPSAEQTIGQKCPIVKDAVGMLLAYGQKETGRGTPDYRISAFSPVGDSPTVIYRPHSPLGPGPVRPLTNRRCSPRSLIRTPSSTR